MYLTEETLQQKAYLFTADNSNISYIEPKNGTDFKGEEIHNIIGGFIEPIYCKGFIIFGDEDGHAKQLPDNLYATMIAGQPIVGNAVSIPVGMVH